LPGIVDDFAGAKAPYLKKAFRPRETAGKEKRKVCLRLVIGLFIPE
jgi:hypothetical protein